MINHLKNVHNFYTPAVLNCFDKSFVESKLPLGAVSLIDSAKGVTKAGHADNDTAVVLGSSFPRHEYHCYICNVVFADCGAHLLFQVQNTNTTIFYPKYCDTCDMTNIFSIISEDAGTCSVKNIFKTMR